MSLDVTLSESVYSANITHNLGKMASEAGIYQALWRPEEEGYYQASDLIEPLTKGLALLTANPEKFKAFNSPNGWGIYEHFVPFVAKYLEACVANPTANIEVNR
jgi:hypothetical protein